MSNELTLPVGVKTVSEGKPDSQILSIDRPVPVVASVILESLAEVERNHIEKVLLAFEGNKTKAAKTLGVSLKTLYNKLHSYGLMASKNSEE